MNEELDRRYSRRKNTKTWCRGKVGVEHVFEWHVDFKGRKGWHEETCKNCGKSREYWINSFAFPPMPKELARLLNG